MRSRIAVAVVALLAAVCCAWVFRIGLTERTELGQERARPSAAGAAARPEKIDSGTTRPESLRVPLLPSAREATPVEARLRGRVLGAGRTPLPGATVVLRRHMLGAFALPAGVREELATIIAEGVSGADGEFSLPVPPGPAHKDSGQSRSAPGTNPLS